METHFGRTLVVGARREVEYEAVRLGPLPPETDWNLEENGIVVLDEPTGTMDPITRVNVTDSILKARAELEQTFIIVSHDMDFVLDVCDRAALMRGGKLLDVGTPEEIVDQLTPDEKEDMLKER